MLFMTYGDNNDIDIVGASGVIAGTDRRLEYRSCKKLQR